MSTISSNAKPRDTLAEEGELFVKGEMKNEDIDPKTFPVDVLY
jgi:hypothetical protein